MFEALLTLPPPFSPFFISLSYLSQANNGKFNKKSIFGNFEEL